MHRRVWGFASWVSLWVCVAGGAPGWASDPFVASFAITPPVQAVLDNISADSLRGHLSFLASDLLEGRDSPSRGLDIAAEYIAAQFRRAGLEPAGDDGYFQTARWFLAVQDMKDFNLQVDGGGTFHVRPDEVSFRVKSGIEYSASEVTKLQYSRTTLAALSAEQVQGKVVITELPDFRREPQSKWEGLLRQQRSFLDKLSELSVALLVSVDRGVAKGDGAGPGWLIDPEQREAPSRPKSVPWVKVYSPEWICWYDRLPEGTTRARVSIRIPDPLEKPVTLRNVMGLLPGSDPVLRETCVLLTAHYDHVGVKQSGDGDLIYNGANDNGSGTASVIELASALSRLSVKPKRSLLFVTVFAEEKGLMGSRYYVRHPSFPIEKTVANLNLEVVGRTDSTEGIERNRASLTGFDYSTIGAVLKHAGSLVGVDVYKHERFSDAFFGRSDNQAFADQGVPAHSLCTVFMYPDYHSVGDHWDKIDYPNLEKITRTVALGLLMLGENPSEPKWNEANPKAAPYFKAWQERRKR
jgi:Peptidase family M28